MNIITAPELLAPEQVAEILQVHTSTLERWRFTGHGPSFLKLGSSRRSPIRYRRQDVEDWLFAHARGGDKAPVE